MHYLITGHTGFKGAWLTLLLTSQGHKVSGLALDPEPGSLFDVADVAKELIHDFRVDIRDATATSEAIQQVKPDVVMHLAAQPLVRESYKEPRATFETNVMGTLNVVEAVSNTESVKAHVVVTTDKVYRNVNRVEGYKEDEPLGGVDPYSASKAMADILTQSWLKCFSAPPTAIARAGNVIGGGDVSKDRLLVDLLANFVSGDVTEIRFPDAVRPWQHVLDCVNGYVALADALLAGNGLGEWNFGPGVESFVSVRAVSEKAASLWGENATWIDASSGEHPHEANLLALDASKAEANLNWHNVLSFDESLMWTVDWQKRVARGGQTPRFVTMEQIVDFKKLQA
jgi:CDP-glucose 4,6-dehydratase